MTRKFIITAELRDLESQVAREEISYNRMIEILNEKAAEYATNLITSLPVDGVLNNEYKLQSWLKDNISL